MPSWDFDGKQNPDPDAIEVPDPYTESEWASTEGAANVFTVDEIQALIGPRPAPICQNSIARAFENVDPAPFIDGWYNRDPE